MTLADFANDVRDLISDALPDGDENYRWTPSDLLRWVNEGRRQMFRMRPEAFYLSKIVTSCPAALEADAKLDIADEYIADLTNYVAYRCLSRDNEDAETMALAEKYRKKFIAGL